MRKDLVDRLMGEYRVPIEDGLGPAGGEEPDNPLEFVRTFPTTPLQREAAEAIKTLVAERDRARRCLAFFASVIKFGESWSQACQDEYDDARR